MTNLERIKQMSAEEVSLLSYPISLILSLMGITEQETPEHGGASGDF